MLRQYKAPDLHAPRRIRDVYKMMNHDLYAAFLRKYPEHFDTSTYKKFDEAVSLFNEELWRVVLDYRDGVDLPEMVGTIFIGTCRKAKRRNVDFHKSQELEVNVNNQNHETDSKLAKIFYSNYQNKYKFKNRIFWEFKGWRSFCRTLAKRYPTEWKRYVEVSPDRFISNLYRRHKGREVAIAITERKLPYYDEFDLD